jgi:hypothetical protein
MYLFSEEEEKNKKPTEKGERENSMIVGENKMKIVYLYSFSQLELKFYFQNV